MWVKRFGVNRISKLLKDDALDELLQVEIASGVDGVMYPQLRSTCVPTLNEISSVVLE